jgi:ABC-type polysaccharide/polyol phosphate export permease
MSQLSRLFLVARTDFSYFFRTKWLMAVLISLNVSDMLVFGLVITNIVNRAYFAFLVPGIVTIGLFSAATDTGRRVWLALREGVVQYYMTLPIGTTGLVVAYIISGGLGGLVYSSALLVIALIAATNIAPSAVQLQPQNIVNAILLFPFLFVLSTGIAGLAAFFASISRRGEMYWVYAQALQVTMITVSTIFYPAAIISQYLPGPIATIAENNPLSLAATALRSSAFGPNPLDTGVLTDLILTSLPLALLGAAAYWAILRNLRLRGKP